MASCLKRAVLTAGDRPARIKAAASTVQAALAETAKRVQPHAGAPAGGYQTPGLRHGALSGGNPILDALKALGQAVDGFAREVSDALSDAARQARETAATLEAQQLARIAVGIVYQPYTEPMTIPAPEGLSVAAVLCARAVITSAPDEYLRPGTACDFKTEGADKLSIREIDGMTIGDPRTITFTFVFVGV